MEVPVRRTIIFLKTKQSTLSSPLGFFADFYGKGMIKDAIDSFIKQVPDVDDPADPYAGKVSFVSSDQLEFHLEHTEELYDDDNNIIGLSPLTECLIFSEQLKYLLYLQYIKSINLIKSKYDSFSLNKSKNEFFPTP